jgi:hypothetical protein
MDSMEPPKVEQMVEQTWNKRGTNVEQTFFSPRAPLFFEKPPRAPYF